MGLVRLKIRELADEKGWTLKEVADRANVPYSIEDLVEVLEE
jgi:putative transcriptional regulator